MSSRECSLARAAARLGTSVDALRRLIQRRARLVRGLLEARFDGIRAWKRGRKWAATQRWNAKPRSASLLWGQDRSPSPVAQLRFLAFQ